MLRIVSPGDPAEQRGRYQRAVAAARAALEQAIAVSVPADASFAERERAILAAANDACRRALETTLQAVAHPDQVRGGWCPGRVLLVRLIGYTTVRTTARRCWRKGWPLAPSRESVFPLSAEPVATDDNCVGCM